MRRYFGEAAHALRVGAEHRDGADVVQDVFGRDGLRADARFAERDVLGRVGVELMGDHRHGRPSSKVFTVKGLVGLVDDGSQLAKAATRMISGACPPPAPSM